MVEAVLCADLLLRVGSCARDKDLGFVSRYTTEVIGVDIGAPDVFLRGLHREQGVEGPGRDSSSPKLNCWEENEKQM